VNIYSRQPHLIIVNFNCDTQITASVQHLHISITKLLECITGRYGAHARMSEKLQI